MEQKDLFKTPLGGRVGNVTKGNQLSLPSDYFKKLRREGLDILYGRCGDREILFSPYQVCLVYADGEGDSLLIQMARHNIYEISFPKKTSQNGSRITIPQNFVKGYLTKKREVVFSGLGPKFLLLTPEKFIEDAVTGEVLVDLLNNRRITQERINDLAKRAKAKEGKDKDWSDIKFALEEIMISLQVSGLVEAGRTKLTDKGRFDAELISRYLRGTLFYPSK